MGKLYEWALHGHKSVEGKAVPGEPFFIFKLAYAFEGFVERSVSDNQHVIFAVKKLEEFSEKHRLVEDRQQNLVLILIGATLIGSCLSCVAIVILMSPCLFLLWRRDAKSGLKKDQ